MPRVKSIEAIGKLRKAYNLQPVTEKDEHIPRLKSVKTPYMA